MDFEEIIAKNETFQAEIKEKGSRFIAYAFAFENEESFKEKWNAIAAENSKSRHVCYAYRFLSGLELIERVNDAGEPKNSAGIPILNQLKSKKLVNAAVVVVRYFGGTKLGLGGLVAAYKQSASLVLEQAETKAYVHLNRITLCYDYQETSEIQRLLHSTKIYTENKRFFEQVIHEIGVDSDDFEELRISLKQWIKS